MNSTDFDAMELDYLQEYSGLMLCRSDLGDGGWSLYLGDTTDEEIREGDATPLLAGPAAWIFTPSRPGEWSRPNAADYRAALITATAS